MRMSAWILGVLAMGGLLPVGWAAGPAPKPAPKPTPQTAPLPVVKTGDNYQVLAGPIGQVKRALAGKLALEILPEGRWKFSELAQTLLDVSPPKTVKLNKVKLRNPDLARSEPKLRRFEIPFRAQRRGKHELKLKIDFVICNDVLCQKKKFDLPYTLNAG